MFQRVGLTLGTFLVAATAGWPQSFTASVRGVVTDASDAAIPGARVIVKDAQRNTEFPTTSDAMGRYVVTALPPSSYLLIVEAAGFKRAQVGPFTLQVQQPATVDVRLELGEVATTVEVGATAPLLNTTIANLGQVVDNKFILQMPLLGRSPLALTYLAPGIVGSGGRKGESNTNFVANGARNSTSDVMLDGVSVTNVEQNSGITQLKYTPSVDAVQEFKVQTNFFSAEFGNTGGAVINMVTKSGTNEFHGAGYHFYRNASLNANDFFANRAGRDLPPFRRHLFGGVIGGPIKKDRVFFFSTYERTDQQNTSTGLLTVPTDAERRGDFSNYRNPQGQLITIYNPFDTFTDATGAIKRRPFPGNIVPLSMQHPISRRVIEYYPAPNTQGVQFTNQNNWFGQGVNSSKNNQTDQKIDWNISEKNRINGRYSAAWGKSSPANLFGNAANPFNTGPGKGRTHNAVTDFTRMQNPTTIFTFRAGYLWQYGDRLPFENFSPTQLGLTPLIEQNADYLVFPRFEAEGYANLGSEGWLVIGREESVTQFSGSMTKIVGGHNLKTGAEFRHFRLDYLQPGHPSGNFGFIRQITREDRFAGSGVQGNGLASMLLGWGSSSNFHHDPWSYSYSRYWGFYVQDDWKVTRKLTLNLGLRYDFDIPRWEKENRYSYWNLSDPHPIASRVPGLDVRGFFEFTDDKTRSPFNGDYNNFQPRLGLAYAVNDKTSVRAGYGLFYTLSRATIKGHLGSGFMSNSTVEWSRDANVTQFATLDNPFPNGLNLPPGRSLGPNTFLGLGAGTIVRENRNPEYHSWNFSIQRELPLQSVIEVNYTGSRGTHLLMPDTSLSRLDPQYWGLGRTTLNALVDNPFFGVITDPRSQLSAPTVPYHRLLRPMPHFLGTGRSDAEPGRGNSHYHALQFRYEKRFTRGFTVLTHYTIAKMIDDISHSAGNVTWLGGDSSIQDFSNLRNERSLSTHDIPQRLVVSFSYQLPIGTGKAVGGGMGRLANALVGGWEVSGLMTFQSGVPLNVTQDAGVLWDATQRPHLIGDPSMPGNVLARLNGYFNVNAFQRPPGDVIGSAPRTLSTYRAPGLRNVDLALFKQFQISESKRFEFRFETFNTTNTPAFGMPNRSFGSQAFGVINGYMSGAGPREVQLGSKFYF